MVLYLFHPVRTSRGLTDQADRKLPGSICNIDRMDKHRQPDRFFGTSYQHEESGDVIYERAAVQDDINRCSVVVL